MNIQRKLQYLWPLILMISIASFRVNKYFLILSQILLLFYLIKNSNWLSKTAKDKDYCYVRLYLGWASICIIRAFFVASDYVEYRHILEGVFCVLPPTFIYLFYRPSVSSCIMQTWFKYIVPLALIFLGWKFGFSSGVSPVLFFACFVTLFKPRYVILILLLLLLSLYDGYSEGIRSQMAQGFIALGVGVLTYLIDKRPKMVQYLPSIRKYSFCLVVVVFGYLLSGLYGMLNGRELAIYEKGEDGQKTDTRSLLYYDVINSSIQNDYYIFGRTPCQGNDIDASAPLFLYAVDNDITVFHKGQRFSNEVPYLNIFTWEGIIGLLFYFMLYIKASYLAVNKSKNKYIKVLGCYIALRWVCGFIDDYSDFDMMNISLWGMMGVCFSPYYREMTDVQFKSWIRSWTD